MWLRSYTALALLLAPIVAHARVTHAAPIPDAALSDATRAWKSLETDHKRRDRRDLWEHVIDRLEHVARDGVSAKTRETALQHAADAAKELAVISGAKKDRSKAEALAHEVTETHAPKPDPEPEASAAAPVPVQVAKAAPDDDAELSPDSLNDLVAVLGANDAPETKATPRQVAKLRTAALADTSVSLSEQAGLKVRRIIVDAGHGGHDTGAIGPTGVREKDVTLAVARAVARELKAHGYMVVLTRDSDDFVSLEDRTAIANRAKGDLFVSIHANSSESHRPSGVETYSLNVASNRFAMRLAARENATSESTVSDLRYLLADLATRANTVDSDNLAECVQESLVGGVARKFGRPKDNGVKHALFYVLLGTQMPAILVETQFISNPREEKHLAAEPYRELVAKSIASGVDRFVSRRQEMATAAR